MITPKKFKLARRLGAPIFEKCASPKFSLEQNSRGLSRRGSRRMSDYGTQLIEKQKVRFYYNISERQFKRYIAEAMRSKHPARTLFELLESRLDSVALRAGFAPTRFSARQLVSHGHLIINNRRTTVPSHRVRVGDSIGFREGSVSSRLYSDAVERTKTVTVPNWLELDMQKMFVRVTGIPAEPDALLDFQSVIEFYSR